MKKLHIFSFAAALLLTAACNRLDIAGMVVNRSDTEERVAEWLDWNAQHGTVSIENAPDTYKVYSASDAHYSDRDTFALQGENDRLYRFVTIERNDPEAQFSILAGDLADERGEVPFQRVDSSLRYNGMTQSDNDSCFVIMGNHDVYYDCATWYKKYFHTSTYPVVVNTLSGYKDLFLFLDSSNGTHGKRQLDWLEEQLSHRSEYRNCVVVTHCWMFRTSYNYTTTPAANFPEDEQYAFMDLMSRNEVSLVVMGHFHHHEHRQFGGVTYVMTDNLNEGTLKPSYLVMTCGEKVSFECREL